MRNRPGPSDRNTPSNSPMGAGSDRDLATDNDLTRGDQGGAMDNDADDQPQTTITPMQRSQATGGIQAVHGRRKPGL